MEFSIGLEGKGTWNRPHKIALGPTLAWEGTYFWIATGAVFGLNNDTNDIEARLIIGVPF